MSRTYKSVIVIVDDDGDTRSLFKTILSARYPSRKVMAVSDGKECLEALERIGGSLPSLVITDFRMPVMNGKELMRKIREKYPGVKVILITATTVSKDGFDDILFKPVEMKDLFECIDAILPR